MTDIQGYADKAMFKSAPMQADRDSNGNIVPTVHLLSITPDPLGSVAAMCRMYEGKPTYSLEDISDAERHHYFQQALATHLKAPLEAIKFHFFIEGVTRSFTHQMVRQRTAVYSQESLRFAVKDDLAADMSVPPSLSDFKDDDPRRVIWDRTVAEIQRGYEQLISAGIPQEDARALMPHGITTRLNYITDLRNLAEHAGNRLCTQAQFEWRAVFTGMVKAIGEYLEHGVPMSQAWQYRAIAESNLFRPVCYTMGKCPFQATFDRACTIRERADRGAFDEINPAEWLLDSTSARVGGSGH